MPTVPTTVVFDLGNVLVRWNPFGPFEGAVARQDVEQFFAEVDFPALNHRQDAGRPWAEARFPHRAWYVDRYVSHFADSLRGPVPGTADVLEALLADGVRALGLTNWSAELFHHAVPAAPAIGRLEDVLVSGRVGVAKPDPAIYRLLMSRYALDPAVTVFVDDSAANVQAASAVGLVGLLFRDAATLEQDLRGLGLLAGPGRPDGPL